MSADLETEVIRPSPSRYLANNLRNTGHALGFRKHWPNKVNLLRVNLSRKISKEQLRRLKRPKKLSGRPRFQTLQGVLGEYMRLVDPFLSGNTAVAKRNEAEDLDHALSIVFRPENHEYLIRKGYDVEDLVTWAWILESTTPWWAVSRMFTLEAERRSERDDGEARLPVFIPVFLLDEQHVDAHSFRLLLIYCLHFMSGQSLQSLAAQENVLELSNWTSVHFKPRVDKVTGMIMFVRLIRHARKVWPHALPVIAMAFSRMYTSGFPPVTKHRAARYRNDILNTGLWLLSLPCKLHPYQSTYIQEQAQFEVLRAMASHDPIIPLTRRSYQAVVAVQLAHKKTLAERQAAELKAPSWPPWKEERLGIDADRGNEGMYSRAEHVLSQMNDAGYSHTLWEKTASILAGWDTDRSPTVQTRRVLPLPRRSFRKRKSDSDPDHFAIWAARIRATRTIREAWACFLSYQDKGLKRTSVIYFAMAERLIRRAKLLEDRGKAPEGEFNQLSHALPGDGLEVYPEPASARDIIYVRTEPPTWQEFVDDMISQGIRPSGRFLALLLRSAPNFRSGLYYLRNSDLTEDQITALCSVWYQPSMAQNAPSTVGNARFLEALGALPDHIFASFIQFLSPPWGINFKQVWGHTLQTYHFPMLLVTQSHSMPVDEVSNLEERDGPKSYPASLWHAVQLAKLRRPICHEAWSNILIALCSKGRNRPHLNRHRCLYHILDWLETLKTIEWMKSHSIEPGSKGFDALCMAFHKAISAATRYIGLTEEAYRLVYKVNYPHLPMEHDKNDTFDDLVETGLQHLKSEFDYLVIPSSWTSEPGKQSVFRVDGTSNDTATKPPPVLHVPSFATLHLLARNLGLAEDVAGLLDLLRWMGQSASPLNELADERLNGHRMRRRALLAIRVAMENLHKGQRISSTRAGMDPRVREARDIVSQVPGWEWPSDAEVEEYLE